MSFSPPLRATLTGFLLIVLFLPFELLAQSATTIKGTISDPDGKPIPGASVGIKGTPGGTTTAADGSFTLNFMKKGGDVLTVSNIGYTDQEIVIGSQTEFNIRLDRNDQSMNAVVVVGYGTQRKRDVTGSVVSVDKKRLENMPNTNFYQALEGSMPGVALNTNGGGAEGNNMSITIRGQKSINGSRDVLIILDGIPYQGSISDINPTDIASVSVLKDASAAAIYGARAANGVILITTKRGATGKPVISYDGFIGSSNYANLPPVLKGMDFYNFKTTREPGSITGTEQDAVDNQQFTDWLDLATRTGQQQQHTVSIRGGTNNMKYYASASLLDVKGIAINDKFKRISTRANLEVNITDWLMYGTNTQLSFNDRSGLAPSFSGNYGVYTFNPLTKPYDENGQLTIYPWPEDAFFQNPLAPTLAKDKDLTYKVFSTNYLQVKIPYVKGLSYRLNTGVEYQNREIATYWGRDTRTGVLSRGELDQTNSNTRSYIIENILNYDRSFGKHTVGFTGLYSYQDDVVTSNSLNAVGFPNDVLTFYQANVADLVTPSTRYEKRTVMSLMGRINYNYDGRYLLTITQRRDGSSGFGANNKFAYFPSVAVGWNIHNEKFFPANTFIDNLKLRASYGRLGNTALSAYQTLAKLQTLSYVDGSATAPGYVPDAFANPSLKWEPTTTANVAIDFSILKSRLSGTIEYFNGKTTDLLLRRSVSPVQGITSIIQNIGETNNRGFELSLNSTNIQTKDFSWTTTANLTILRNKIVDLYGDGKDDTASTWFIGHPIDVNFGYVYDGVWQITDDTLNTPQGAVKPGMAKIKDINGDKVINAQDRTLIGNNQPKFTWGMGNTFTYKNLSLYVFMYGVQGRRQPNPMLSDNGVNSGVRYTTVVKNWWTRDNPTNDFYANMLNATQGRTVNIYENSSFVRIRDISLTYDFSGKWLQKTGLTRLKAYAQVRNPFTFTDWSGLDPEFPSQNAVPLQREFTFGLNVSL